MNIFKFYDYIYFRLSCFFEKNGGEDRDRSVSILSVVQCLNLLVFLDLISLLLNYPINLPHFVKLLLGILIFFILNSIRYRLFKTYQDLNRLWGNEKESIRIRRGFFMILYFILSIIMSAFSGYLALSYASK